VSVTFELYLLDGGNGETAVALGRCGNDAAIERLSLNGGLAPLVKFGQRIGELAEGGAAQITEHDVSSFGAALFEYLFPKSLGRLFSQVSAGKLSLQILSDHPGIKNVPWEFIVTPDKEFAPHSERVVVRVHPTCGIKRPDKVKASSIRILFVTAAPIGQGGVPVDEVLGAIKRTFRNFLPANVEITVLEAANTQALVTALNEKSYDVFHFYGHGEVRDNGSGLLLQGVTSKRATFVPGKKFASLLTGKGIQLAILSACNSAAGAHTGAFDAVATSLITAGVPAVLANQYPIHYTTIAPFVCEVYGSLVKHGNIDDAVAEGRVRLYTDVASSSSSGVVDWGIPVLYRLSDAQQLFDL
jgi:hypothetical protein